MGEDTRATDARSIDQAGLRARSAAARRAAGDSRQAGPAGRGQLKHSAGPFQLNEQALESWGRQIGAAVQTPVVFALRGDLGAGKSVLARAIAHGAGVAASMPSPTFNLLFRYETRERIISHLDLYRLIDPDEVWELGWRELGEDHEIVLIEWPERAEHLLPAPRWDISLVVSERDSLLREVTAAPVGNPPEIPLPQT